MVSGKQGLDGSLCIPRLHTISAFSFPNTGCRFAARRADEYHWSSCCENTVNLARNAEPFHLGPQRDKVDVPSRQAGLKQCFGLIREKYDMLPTFCLGRLNKARFPGPFPNKTEAQPRNAARLTYQGNNGFEFMHHSVITRIHHHKPVLQPVLMQKFIVIPWRRSKMTSIGPVRDVYECTSRQAVREKVALHASPDHHDLIHPAKRPPRHPSEKPRDHSFAKNTRADGNFRKDILEPANCLDRHEEPDNGCTNRKERGIGKDHQTILIFHSHRSPEGARPKRQVIGEPAKDSGATEAGKPDSHDANSMVHLAGWKSHFSSKIGRVPRDHRHAVSPRVEVFSQFRQKLSSRRDVRIEVAIDEQEPHRIRFSPDTVKLRNALSVLRAEA